jgi:histidinol-phosphate/aromatic aminotransferase/cobyric acid decarboxylase-like protein
MHGTGDAPTAAPGRVHGGLHDAELAAHALHPSEVLDFSTSCNPYGPSPYMLAALAAAPIARYPDPTALHAREALARSLDTSPSQLALGNGAAELLWSLARALLAQGAHVLIVEPAFCELRLAAERCGARVHGWHAPAEQNYAIELDAVLRAARACNAQLVYLCAPSTPAGAPLAACAIAEAARAAPRVRFIVDESFLSLSERFADARVALPPNAIRVRSLTKEHAIPGVRVGYAIAAPHEIAALEAQRPPWTTGAHAQAAAIAACSAGTFVADSRARLLASRARLAADLRALGLTPLPSSTGFMSVRTGAAAALRARLLGRHRILVRDCASFDMPDFIRIAARPEADCARLLDALRKELHA